MGEAVTMTGEEEWLELDEIEKEKENGFSDMIKQEKFLPRMALRVLLVEADDSTRQIIAALLRKCSYIVTAVPDGLKAWDIIKGRPHDIELILTEVELPLISGYALLTLIMEHEICKNIPVIMMSSHDSISVVLKCMLKGAADFLVKPVRRNELKNLWQHVWRRQTQLAAQHKVETTSKNNAASNHSSDNLASTLKNKELSEKGSDAQSSCTTPYLEAESAYMQNMQGLPQTTCGSVSHLDNIERHEECVKLVEKSVTVKMETERKSIRSGPDVASGNKAYNSTAFRSAEEHICSRKMTRNAGVLPESQSEIDNIPGEIHCHPDEIVEPSSEAIDLIGIFENHRAEVDGHSSVNHGAEKSHFAPRLELSLRRSDLSCLKYESTDDLRVLNHSNASAFSLYDRKTVQSLFPTSVGNHAEVKEDAISSCSQVSNQLPENSVGTLCHGAVFHNDLEDMTNMMVTQSEQGEAAFLRSQLGLIPVSGIKFDSLCAGYGQLNPPMLYAQLGFPEWHSRSSNQREQSPFPISSSHHSSSDIYSLGQGYCPFNETTNHSADQTVQEEDIKMESVEELSHGSPARTLSANSSLCNDISSKVNSSACESMCDKVDDNATPDVAIARASVSKSVNDNHLLVHDGLRGMDSRCSTQREAALLKFRLKRKDRCFEKKVRYQSRKRLAEQRPRVKGQFVRQVQTDSDCCS